MTYKHGIYTWRELCSDDRDAGPRATSHEVFQMCYSIMSMSFVECGSEQRTQLKDQRSSAYLMKQWVGGNLDD